MMMTLPETLTEIIEPRLKDHFCRPTKVLSYNKLNSNNDVHVVKINLIPPGPGPGTVVMKYAKAGFNGGDGVDLKEEFLVEDFNYRFLSRIRHSFDLFPGIIGRAPGMILMQDLGKHTHQYLDDASCAGILAETFARLHAVTADKYPIYQKMKQECRVQHLNLLKDPMRRHNEYYNFAVQQLKNLGEPLQIDLLEYDNWFHDIKEEINNPGIFFVFIHDDLESDRNSVMDEEKLYLLDFERGKYAHALLDVAKPMVGRVCNRVLKDRKLFKFIRHSNFSMDFAGQYRQKFEQYRDTVIEDNHWNMALSSALIYTTVMNIGYVFAATFSMNLPLEYSLTSTVKSLIARLVHLLEGNDTHKSLTDILARLSRCIYT